MAGGWGAQPGVFTPLLQSEDGSSVHHLSAWPLTSIPCVNRQNKQNEGRGRGKGDKGARYAPPLPASRTGKTLMQRPRRRRQGRRRLQHTRVCVRLPRSALSPFVSKTRGSSPAAGGWWWGWGGRMSRCSCPAGGRARMDEPSEQRRSEKTFSLITRACRKHTRRQRLRQQAASLNKLLLINIKSASTNKHLSCLFPQMIPSRFLHVQTEHPGRCCLISALQSE